MKKVYAFLAAAMVATAANAQTAYLRGQAAELNWDNDYSVAAVDGTITIKLTNAEKFKLSTTGGASWDEFNVGALAPAEEFAKANLGTAIALTASTADINLPWAGDYTLVIPADFSTITATTTTPAPASYTTLYLRGAAPLDWNTNTEVTAANGVFKFELAGGTQFKMSVTGGAEWDEFNPGCYVASLNASNLGQKVTLTAGDANILLPWEGDWTIEVADDMSYIVATTTTPAPVGALSIYLRGDMNNWLNDATDELKAKWQMSTEDGVIYWFDCVGETVITTGQNFKIADANWGSVNYGAGDEVIPQPDVEEEMALEWFYNGDNAVMGVDYTGTIKAYLPEVTGSGDYNMLVVFYPEIVKHETSGVANIVVENEAPVYYNLQGVRVANPSNGIYIERCGSKVSKVLVK